MPAKKSAKKKAQAESAAASEEGVSMAQLRAQVARTTAALERLLLRDAELRVEQMERDAALKAQVAERDAEFRKEQAERDAERAAQDAEFRKEREKRDAEQAAQDAKFRKEQAERDAKFHEEQEKRDAERDAWMKQLGESDKTTRKRIEAAEKARGRAAETHFRKALPGLLADKGMSVDHVVPHALKVEDREYDFIARNGKMNFVGEIKTRFQVKDLAQLSRLLLRFREDCPELAGDRPIYGVVCGTTVDEDAANIARREGFLVVEGQAKAKLHMPPKIREH